MSAGYSNQPLVKKLGIKEGSKVRIIDAPENYFELLGDLAQIEILENNSELADFIHLFSKMVEHFENHIFILKDEIEKNGMIWVSWYKKASKIKNDMNEDIIRNTDLSLGLVDIKVYTVD